MEGGKTTMLDIQAFSQGEDGHRLRYVRRFYQSMDRLGLDSVSLAGGDAVDLI